ncbi:MAG: sensor histidine kinase, partial [Pannonibacter indicus]
MAQTSPGRGDHKTAINRERAQRRREVARTVSQVRDRLSAKEGVPPDFNTELLLLFARARVSAAFAGPMFLVIVAAVSLMWISPVLVACWLMFTVSIWILTVSTCRRFERMTQEERQTSPWRRRFAVGDFLYGLCWGAFFLLPASSGTAEGIEIFQFSIMLIVIAMATMQSSTLPHALLASTLPVTLAMSLALLQRHAPHDLLLRRAAPAVARARLRQEDLVDGHQRVVGALRQPQHLLLV